MVTGLDWTSYTKYRYPVYKITLKREKSAIEVSKIY